MSIREASQQLGCNPHYVKGLAQGLGIRMKRAGRTFILSEKDVARLRAEVDRQQAALPATTQSA